MNPALLLSHAAGLLSAEARGLIEDRTPNGQGDWLGEPEAKALYEDLTTTAARLIALANQIIIKNEKGIL